MQWHAWGASIVRVHSSADTLCGGDLLDDKNELGDWLGSAQPAVLLIRPDRFCMVHAHPREADDRLRRAYALIAGGV